MKKMMILAAAMMAAGAIWADDAKWNFQQVSNIYNGNGSTATANRWSGQSYLFDDELPNFHSQAELYAKWCRGEIESIKASAIAIGTVSTASMAAINPLTYGLISIKENTSQGINPRTFTHKFYFVLIDEANRRIYFSNEEEAAANTSTSTKTVTFGSQNSNSVGTHSATAPLSSWSGAGYWYHAFTNFYGRATVGVSSGLAGAAGGLAGVGLTAKSATAASVDYAVRGVYTGASASGNVCYFARANQGYKFEGWTTSADGAGDFVSTANPYVVAQTVSGVDAGHRTVAPPLYAVFSQQPAGAAISISAVQQRYPWNGKVDIDYTVANADPAFHHVRFTLTENGHQRVLHEFVDDGKLFNASNGTYRATWNSLWEDAEYRFFTRNASLTAEIIYDGGDKDHTPYGARYVIIDLAGGASAAAYPVTERRIHSFDEATNLFNSVEYQTDKLVLRRVRCDTFSMGSPAGETGRENNGSPGEHYNRETLHPVEFRANFLLGMFEVTQSQYLQVMGTNPSVYGDTVVDTRPVQTVSYQLLRGTNTGLELPPTFGRLDADTFLGRISARTGLDFDLPTEAQWEFACRAGTSSATYVGDTGVNLNDIAWWGFKDSGTAVNDAGYPAGRKTPNAWGFYDMLGNVWEICRDRVANAPNDNWGTAAVANPLRGYDGTTVTLRGGSTGNGAIYQRAACRLARTTDRANWGIGFRLSRTLP